MREIHKDVRKRFGHKGTCKAAVTLANIEGVLNATVSCMQMDVLTNAVERGLSAQPDSR